MVVVVVVVVLDRCTRPISLRSGDLRRWFFQKGTLDRFGNALVVPGREPSRYDWMGMRWERATMHACVILNRERTI
jgi:hypothetical protein